MRRDLGEPHPDGLSLGNKGEEKYRREDHDFQNIYRKEEDRTCVTKEKAIESPQIPGPSH